MERAKKAFIGATTAAATSLLVSGMYAVAYYDLCSYPVRPTLYQSLANFAQNPSIKKYIAHNVLNSFIFGGIGVLEWHEKHDSLFEYAKSGACIGLITAQYVTIYKVFGLECNLLDLLSPLMNRL